MKEEKDALNQEHWRKRVQEGEESTKGVREY